MSDKLEDGFLAHAIDEEVGPAIDEDGGTKFIAPIVVVGKAAKGGFDATDDDGHVGVELLENACIDDGGHLGPQVVASVGRIGILAAQTAGCGVFVDHRVHGSRRDSEKESGASQLLEVAVVAVPVGLRHDGHAQSLAFEQTTDDGCGKRGVIDVGIATEQDDVELIPTTQFTFFFRGGQEVGQTVFLGVHLHRKLAMALMRRLRSRASLMPSSGKPRVMTL